MPCFPALRVFDFQECVRPVASTRPGDASVGNSDVESPQVVVGWVECGVAEDASGRGMPEHLANGAKAAFPVFFLVMLGHGGVDLHGVVVAVFVAMCAKVAP